MTLLVFNACFLCFIKTDQNEHIPGEVVSSGADKQNVRNVSSAKTIIGGTPFIRPSSNGPYEFDRIKGIPVLTG